MIILDGTGYICFLYEDNNILTTTSRIQMFHLQLSCIWKQSVNKPIKQCAYRGSLVVVSWLHCIWDQDSTRTQSDFGRGFECNLVSSFGWHALQTTRVSVSELTYPVVLGWSWHWSPSRRLYRDWLGMGTVTYWVKLRVMANTDTRGHLLIESTQRALNHSTNQ